MSEKITIGRTVHYVMDKKYEDEKEHKHRPAIVVEVWNGGTLPPDGNGCVNLQVAVDGSNDIGHSTYLKGTRDLENHIREVEPFMWVTSATYDETGKQPGSWHFPERD